MKRLLSILALAWAFATPAHALESAAVRSARAVVTMVTDTNQVAPGTPFHAALRLRLAPGWHSYWQNPGDAGVAPEFTVEPATGLSVGPVAWPTPSVISEGPLTTFGYTGEVLLPVTVTSTAGATTLRAHANWLVCENICVPEEGDFALDLPGGMPAPSVEAPLFAAAASRTPVASPYPASIAADGTLRLVADRALAASVRSAQFLPLGQAIAFGAPQGLSIDGDTLALALKPAEAFDPKATLDGVLVLRDAQGTASFLSVSAIPGAPAAAAPGTLAELLLLALAGGLVLNLMPCVFPILAMKAMAIARLAGQDRAVVRAHAASYTVGVVLAFVALGGLLLLLRLAGREAGWGFQFQSPVFVALTAWLLFAVGLNLMGVFAVGGGVAGSGQSLTRRGGHAGSFFTGLLAVVVATPCTAPFMGAAIAGAMAASPPLMLLVFAAMGVGLAAPYALLALAPWLVRALPRPGAWMEFVKELLAFPIYGAVVWLVWVLSQEAGPDGVLTVVSGLGLLGFAGWALGRAQRAGGRGRRLGQGAALAGLLATGLLLPGLTAAPLTGAPAQASVGTEPFSAARLAELRSQGHPVFVNMTAAWCVSCLVNERVALGTQAVRDGFAAHGVVYLRGDWTQQDAAISAFLRQHGRDGVPLYVFYLPGKAPQILPQVLTPGLVLAALDPGES